MQVLSIILFIATIILIVLYNIESRISRRLVFILIVITGLLFVLHLGIEQVKWQLYPMYVASTIAIIFLLLQVVRIDTFHKVTRIMTNIVVGLLLILTGGTSFVFPVDELPIPTGEYPIGTTSFVLEDETRFEQYGEDSTAFRKFKIQLWYPAETTESYEKVPWLEDGVEVARALSRDTGLPSFVLDHTVLIDSNSYADAPISTNLDSYPVVVISHGWRGFRNLHTDLAEELASQGYMVVSIDHTYGSVATVFSEDDVAIVNLDALPDREDTPDFLDYANQLVYTYAGDITATLDFLEDLNDNSESPFHQTFDLSHIGLLGHSTGGGAGVAVALQDSRIDAVFGLDSWVEPMETSELEEGLSVPAVFLRSGAWETGYNNEDLYLLISQSTDAMLYQIDGTTHYDFSMVYMYSPLTKAIGFTGEVEGRYLYSILSTMMMEFFNHTLGEEASSTIEPDDWTEVRTISVE